MEIKAVGEKPLRIKRGWFGRLTIEVQDTVQHMKDLNGSGYYDEWTTHQWRKARLEDLILDGVTVAD